MRIPAPACFLVSLVVVLYFAAGSASLVRAQGGAPSSIQLFMPGGGLPNRSMRFILTRDDGRVETLFTDTKGKFLITGDLVRDADYTVTVEGDGRSFETTVVTFRTFRNQVAYIPVFLNPLEGKKRPAPAVLNVNDVNVPASAQAAYSQAMEKAAKGQSEEAIKDLKRALGLHPRYLRALNDLGVLYLKLNRLDEAASTFKQAMAIDQSFLYPQLNLGIVLNRQGKHSEAVEVLGRLYRDHPELSDAAIPYAEVLAENGELAKAEKVLRQAIADGKLGKGAEAEAHFRLGATLNKQNRYAEAAVEFEKVIKLEPNAVMAHLQLGGALIQLKHLPEAERELQKAYELGGKSAGAAQFLLGQAFYLETKYELAIKAFEQYLKDVPNAPNAAQVRDAIDKMRAALTQK